ncbi:MAG: polyphosphate kinase 1 [Acidobacteria bacterium]|nr:polyphosphate kinase 1 [Acidobacteriota bacterium]
MGTKGQQRSDRRKASRGAVNAATRSSASRIALFNRELSRLDYLRRILAEADNPAVPILERLKFLGYTARNLDEFFMVRVGEIRDLIDAGITERSPDGLSPQAQLDAIRTNCRELLREMYSCFETSIAPELARHKIRIEQLDALTSKEQKELDVYFERHIAPLLTPLAIDPGHPFPLLSNLSVNLAVVVESRQGERHIVLFKLPTAIPRFVDLGDGRRFVEQGQLLIRQIARFFPTLTVRNATRFRFIRNAEILLRDDEVEDLRESIEAELRRIERSDVVCLEIEEGAPDEVVELLVSAGGITRDDVFTVSWLPRLRDLLEICDKIDDEELLDQPFNPRMPVQLASSEDIFSIIRRGDVLLHRPYDSFSAIVEFLHAAATDPEVVAIKQTLYQTDEGSPVIEKLLSAAINGKQVTAVIELQARFEEHKNIEWARRLEEAGAQVVYGLVGIKTHCKMALVVRREGDELRRYVHLSTGNYTVNTARSYTDIDLLTCDEAFGSDASVLFNLLTGYSVATIRDVFDQEATRPRWQRFVVAPFDYQRWLIERIERETMIAATGREARIVAKLNAVSDPAVVRALYVASAAGVKIDLFVRSICCLSPGLPGISENIRVMSLVDRYLEHSRLFWFHNDGQRDVWAASGDWMQRNFSRRIEVTWPIVDPKLAARVCDEIIATTLADNVKGWDLKPDGASVRRTAAEGEPAVRCQERFIESARSEAVAVGDYEDTIAEAATVRKKAKKGKKNKKG